MKKWCPKCQKCIVDPGTSEITKYAKFWRDNKCYYCGSTLEPVSAIIPHEKDIEEKREAIKKRRTSFLSWFKGFDLNEVVSQWDSQDIDTRVKAMEELKKLAKHDCKHLARVEGAVDLIIATALKENRDIGFQARVSVIANEISAILANSTGAIEKAMKSIGMKGYTRQKGAGFSNTYTPTLTEILSIEYAKFLNENPGRAPSAEEASKIYQICLTHIKEAMNKLSYK